MSGPRTIIVSLLVASVALVVPGGATGMPDAPAEPSIGLVKQAEKRFVGSWRLVSFEARTATGQVVYPFGDDAEGVLTYTDEARMSGTIWKKGRQPFAVNDQQRGTPDEYAAAVQTYIAYIGTFGVDRNTGTVTHYLDQSIFPNWNGTSQTRFYRFSDRGNTLELTTPPTPFGGTTLVGVVIWERMD